MKTIIEDGSNTYMDHYGSREESTFFLALEEEPYLRISWISLKKMNTSVLRKQKYLIHLDFQRAIQGEPEIKFFLW